MKAHAKLTRTFSFCAFFLPAFYLAVLIQRYGVDTPFQEQWAVAAFFEKLQQGVLGPSDLFAQMNEYRQVFPYILFIVAGKLTSWNVKFEMFMTFLLACMVSLSLYRLGRLTFGGEWDARRVGAYFFSNLLLFSPMQYENWLYGIQVVYLLPVACMCAGLLVAYSAAGARVRFFICACLSLVSTFSAANGILCWLVLLPPLVLLEPRAGRAEGKWLVAGWVACMLLSIVGYSYGYQATPGSPSTLDAVRHPLRAAVYFFSFLGTPLWAGSLPVAFAAGLVLAAAFVFSCVYVWKKRGDQALVRRTLCWLMLGAFSLMTGMLVTLGRSVYGLEQSMTARYIAFSLYLAAAVAHLIPIIAGERGGEAHRARGRALITRVAVAAFVFALAAQARIYPLGTLAMMYTWRDRAHAKACLLFINVLEDGCLSTQLTPTDVLKRSALALDRMSYLRPGLIRSGRLEEIEAGRGGAGAAGEFESLDEEGGGSYVASGWASLPGAGAPADAVLLAFEKGEGTSVVFKLSEPRAEKDYSVMRLREIAYPDLRWRARFSRDELPRGPAKVTAWAFDAGNGKAYRLGGAHAAREAK